MHRTPEFEAYIAEAKALPQIWRLILGVIIILFCYISGTLMILGIAGGTVAAQEGLFGILPFMQDLMLANTPGHLMVMLCTFLGFFLGSILAAAACHYRGPGSLFGDFDEWLRGFLVGIVVTGVILGALTATAFLVDPPEQITEWSTWLKWMPLAIVLLFIQTGGEELVFRGYLQQQLAARFASRAIWMWIPSVIFAALHWNPDAGQNLTLLLLSTLTFGLIAADLTERTGSLGAAMGIHFANNFLALYVLILSPQMRGMALFASSQDIGEVGIVTIGLVVNILAILAVWWGVVKVMERT
ncbi:CPBP family intramembrane metalloprotease [Alphaproteobacteria bacterium KMM 3653]|uniref:CPBP family intramembrane metalloprotease n=1 Tax=Harenicola maris TaxID=2841044 RepID=A0AAP2G7Y9_9RHOB|nr:CPBP family intramembrane metalloprotease [Harenicola maris]